MVIEGGEQLWVSLLYMQVIVYQKLILSMLCTRLNIEKRNFLSILASGVITHLMQWRG